MGKVKLILKDGSVNSGALELIDEDGRNLLKILPIKELRLVLNATDAPILTMVIYVDEVDAVVENIQTEEASRSKNMTP